MKRLEDNHQILSHTIHVRYIYLHLVDFTVNVQENIPYMDGMGLGGGLSPQFLEN